MSEEERKTAYQNGMTLSEEQQLYCDEEDYLEIDKDKEIERLNNIIKEVKEWILFWKEESLTISTDILDELLEILNKGDD